MGSDKSQVIMKAERTLELNVGTNELQIHLKIFNAKVE